MSDDIDREVADLLDGVEDLTSRSVPLYTLNTEQREALAWLQRAMPLPGTVRGAAWCTNCTGTLTRRRGGRWNHAARSQCTTPSPCRGTVHQTAWCEHCWWRIVRRRGDDWWTHTAGGLDCPPPRPREDWPPLTAAQEAEQAARHAQMRPWSIPIATLLMQGEDSAD